MTVIKGINFIDGAHCNIRNAAGDYNVDKLPPVIISVKLCPWHLWQLFNDEGITA